MAEMKTKATKESVSKFIDAIDDPSRRKDCKDLVAMMEKATKAKPVMWGPAIIGLGDHEYQSASKKPTKWFQVGFSPRKAALSLYLMGGTDDALLAKLGPQTKGHSCLYIKRLDDVHRPTLQKLIARSVKNLKTANKTKGQEK